MDGIKYLTRGRRTRFDVKIEIACSRGRHGKTIHIYEGNSKYVAKAVAEVVERKMKAGGQSAVLEWFDNYSDEFINLKQMEEKCK